MITATIIMFMLFLTLAVVITVAGVCEIIHPGWDDTCIVVAIILWSIVISMTLATARLVILSN